MWNKNKIILILVCAAALAFLFLGPYRAYLGGYAPFLLILLCPLLHIFFMRGHHGEHHANTNKLKKSEDDESTPNDEGGKSGACH